MKKIIIITTTLLLLAGSQSFAGTSIAMASPLTKATTGDSVYARADTTTATTSDTLIGKTSTGVGVGIFCTADASGSGYALVTQHMNGTKRYGSAYDSTSLFTDDVATVGTPALTVPTAIDTTNFSSWKEL